MGNIVNLDDYRKVNNMEEDYCKFVTHINKFLGVPTSLPELLRAFSFTLSYLGGTINAFAILSLVKRLPEDKVEELRNMVITTLDGFIEDMKLK